MYTSKIFVLGSLIRLSLIRLVGTLAFYMQEPMFEHRTLHLSILKGGISSHQTTYWYGQCSLYAGAGVRTPNTPHLFTLMVKFLTTRLYNKKINKKYSCLIYTHLFDHWIIYYTLNELGRNEFSNSKFDIKYDVIYIMVSLNLYLLFKFKMCM
jgi:hypothetical protein